VLFLVERANVEVEALAVVGEDDVEDVVVEKGKLKGG
jgi:hypothetical protein